MAREAGNQRWKCPAARGMGPQNAVLPRPPGAHSVPAARERQHYAREDVIALEHNVLASIK